ncbi:MAG TPA: aspartate aminotransferase family protein [Candidatus Cybelea sp.]|nr:aspartate aminotransferase family protein [Candidatus Cybelea sp.]
MSLRDLERLVESVPGPRSKRLASQLRAYESRNVTYLSDDFPVFWESANGATVTDVDGNRYIDCTAAFGVANAGHCNPRVTAAVLEQVERLVHGMGDVHPSAVRVRLFERLSQILPGDLDRVFLATTGSEAIEAALKTAMLYTGKARFAAYRGGYHGLSFGALAVGGIDRFRAPFAAALGNEPLLLDFPKADGAVNPREAAAETHRRLSERDDIAALVVEPIQGRAGIILPPPGYLRELRAVCDERQIVMIVDEIYTGFGRTGTWFAVECEGVVPDILCIGKAMGSGFPISAAAGRSQVMDAWPLSSGEALHTSTYLGHPLGCAAAVATIDEIERLQLPARARRLGGELGSRLRDLGPSHGIVEVRGRGFLWGIAFRDAAVAAAVVKRALRAGAIFLQSGSAGEVIAISPPLVMGEEQLARALEILKVAIEETA